MPASDQAGDHVAVQVGPRRLPVQEEHRLRSWCVPRRRSGPGPRSATLAYRGSKGNPGSPSKRSSGVRTSSTDDSVTQPALAALWWQRRRRSAGLVRREPALRRRRRRRAAWSACPWRTSWPLSALRWRWSTPGTRAAPPTPEQGSSHRPRTSEADDESWPFLQACGRHYGALLQRLAGDGVDVSATGYEVCGALALGLRASEERWFGPYARQVLRRGAGETAEISAAEAADLFPPLGPVHRVLHVPGSARVDGRGMAAALREGALGDVASSSWRGRSAGSTRRDEGPLRRCRSVPVTGAGTVTCGCAGGRGRSVDRGHGGVAGSATARRPDQGADRAPRRRR